MIFKLAVGAEFYLYKSDYKNVGKGFKTKLKKLPSEPKTLKNTQRVRDLLGN